MCGRPRPHTTPQHSRGQNEDSRRRPIVTTLELGRQLLWATDERSVTYPLRSCSAPGVAIGKGALLEYADSVAWRRAERARVHDLALTYSRRPHDRSAWSRRGNAKIRAPRRDKAVVVGG